MKLKKKDNVTVISGGDRGQTGQVLRVLPDKGKVVVEGVRITKKRVRPKKEGEKGQVVEVPQPLDVSSVALVCPQCGERTKIGYRGEGAKQKKRICRKCQKAID